jgi:L-lactate dehydrogenase complex protein LldG
MIASSPQLFTLSQRLAGIGTRILSPFSQWMWIPAFTGWGYSKDFPRFATKTFREKFPLRDADSTEIFKKEKEENKKADAPKAHDVNLVERFSQELEAVGGHAYRVRQDELSKRLMEFLREHDINAAMIWDSISALNESDLTEAGVRVKRSADPTLKAGITGALSAIAETGTLVIPSGKGQPLGASLLAEFHIAIISSSQIVWSLDEALRNEEVRSASAIALITGPSRTADIEMTLTIGVHGPKELHVFVVDD